MAEKIFALIQKNCSKQKKQFAVLVDPDKVTLKKLENIASECDKNNVDYIFVGGSLLTDDSFESTIKTLKKKCNIPVVIFPGNTMQISKSADAILFLSLISGRNPEMLIGKHVIAAPYIKAAKIETIPTGYMLIENGKTTTALYMSSSNPIPHDKADIAVCTAMAGEMLGLKLMYMDAGSGANNVVSEKMISKVKQNISTPLIIGGGIKNAHTAAQCFNAGADIVVVGNAIEDSPSLIAEIAVLTKKK